MKTKAPEELKEEVRHRVARHASGPLNQNTMNEHVLHWEEVRVIQEFLKQHQNLLIRKANKGNSTVIIKKTEYWEKLLTILKDVTTNEKRKTDPITSLFVHS